MAKDHRNQQPKASPAARWVAVLIGLVFLALAGVAIHDIVALHSSRDGIVEPAARTLSEGVFHGWMAAASVGALILGLLLLIAALRPRKNTHLPLKAQVPLWTRPVDIARYTTAHAKEVSGVKSATTTVKRKRVHVEAVTPAPDPSLEGRLGEAVNAALQPLSSAPFTVDVSITTANNDDADQSDQHEQKEERS